MKTMRTNNRGEGGYTLVIALIFFLAATTAVIAGVSDAVFRETRTVKNESLSKQSYYTSESAVEDAAYRLKTSKSVGSSVALSVASSTAVANITTNAGITEIKAEADASGTKRTTSITLTQNGGIAFPFALQAGVGGIDMDGSSQIIGDIYTTGSIRGCSSCSVSGMAVAAGKSTETLHVDNSTPATPTNSITFGNANSSQDLAQSFTISQDLSLMKARVYIRKVGNPANATIRVVTNNSGSPSTTVLASGTLSSSLVSTSYDWEEITFTANPLLVPGITYWIVIDANTNSSNHYVVGANSAYANGQAKVGRYNNSSWNNTTPAGLDAYFQVYIGSNQEGVSGESDWNRMTVGSAYAYRVSFINATDVIYCQVWISNNKDCDTSRADPVITENPVSEAAITAWKAAADDSVYSGNYLVDGIDNTTLGPKKIDGDLTVTDSGTLRVSGTLWVTGDLLISGAGIMRPDQTKNYAIVVDGTVTLTGSAQILGSTGSHILITSTNTADPAVTISGAADDTVISAPNGGLRVDGSGQVNVAAAKHITLDGAAQIQYDPDVSQFDLESGSSGGQFQLKSWKETE